MGRSDQLQDFERFTFQGNPSFEKWLAGVEVTNPNDPVVIRKLQAKWYKREIDVNFDLDWLKGSAPSPASSRPAPSTSSTTSGQYTAPAGSTGQGTKSSTSNDSAYGYGGGAGQTRQPWGGAAWAQGQKGIGAGSARQQRMIFFYHMALLFLAAVALVPSPYNRTAYRTFMQLTILGQAAKVLVSHGLPRMRPFSLQNLQAYLTTLVPTNDFHNLIIGFCFFSHSPIILMVVPATLMALQGVLSYLSVHAGRHQLWINSGARLHRFLQGKQREVQVMSAYSEILVGVMLIMQVFGRSRNIMLTFAFWNLLKLRYHVSDSASAHQQVWRSIDAQTAPLRARIPILNTIAQYATGWFMRAR